MTRRPFVVGLGCGCPPKRSGRKPPGANGWAHLSVGQRRAECAALQLQPERRGHHAGRQLSGWRQPRLARGTWQVMFGSGLPTGMTRGIMRVRRPNPLGPKRRRCRVLRGGSWNNEQRTRPCRQPGLGAPEDHGRRSLVSVAPAQWFWVSGCWISGLLKRGIVQRVGDAPSQDDQRSASALQATSRCNEPTVFGRRAREAHVTGAWGAPTT